LIVLPSVVLNLHNPLIVLATGPIEATVIGNVLVQALAQGQIKSLSEGRALVALSFAGKEYRPEASEAWQAYAQKAADIIS
jgi:rhamnulokinase